jgi:uncharacterized protein YqjF (DUF2071 family)
MYQTWDKLLFLHWPIKAARLRPLIPSSLEIDTWDDSAWIAVTPFTIRGMRPPLLPPVPPISSMHELNVRTYVHRDGVPGVWFLSLDASSRLAVWGARLGYSLPYQHATIEMDVGGHLTCFRSKRRSRSTAVAEFAARWRLGPRLPAATPGTRDFFFVERYCLYSSDGRRVYRARIHHRPWPLCDARVDELHSTMFQAHGLPEPGTDPVVTAQAEPLRVGIWAPELIE